MEKCVVIGEKSRIKRKKWARKGELSSLEPS